MQKAYEIGKRYMVPCVHGSYFGINGYWPVLGPAHEDAEHINFPHLHYHVDVRFIAPHLFRRLSKYRSLVDEPQFFSRSGPLMVRARQNGQGDWTFTKEDLPRIVQRGRTCYRQYERSAKVDGAPWRTKLEGAYRDAKLIRGHCPHRAADLSTLPVDRHGCVECPLHGLRFHVATGRMVPFAEWAAMDQANPLSPTASATPPPDHARVATR